MRIIRMRSTSLLVIFCGVIAIVYLIYRVCLLAFPAVALGDELLHPHAPAPLVCSEENSEALQDPQHEWSASYQTHLDKQKALSPNLVHNSNLTKTDAGHPEGYEKSRTGKHIRYQLLHDNGGSAFLRVHDTAPRAANTAAPAWLMKPVRTKKDASYRYGFWYRSDVDGEVTLEYRTSTSKTLRYENAAHLPKSQDWRHFTAHIGNEAVTSVRVIVNGKTPGQVDTRGYEVTQIPSASLKRGMVSVTFDDGWQSITTHAAPLLSKYNIRTTQYIISDVSAHSEPGYMNFDSVHALKNAGHEIGSHSLAHCNQTSLSSEQISDNALGSKRQLETQGLGPVRTFAYPLGQYNHATQTVYPQHYAYVRSSDAGYNDRYFDATNIRSMGVLDSTTEEEVKGWLERAKAKKQWVVLVYHRVDESGMYSVTSQQLERHLDMVARSGLDVLPLSEAADKIKNEAPLPPKPQPKRHEIPKELPKTGSAIDAIGVAGIIGLVISFSYWRQSERHKRYGTLKR